MSDVLFVVVLGFLLGMRHATDADHVVAVTTIVARQRDLLAAGVTGLLWGIGHTLTIVVVGAAIILFNLAIPYRLGVGMELSVGVMLILLGALNVAAYLRPKLGVFHRGGDASLRDNVSPSPHGNYLHSHSHGSALDVHDHLRNRTTLLSIDRWFGRSRIYGYARPVVVGVVHGLAGSAAVTLLVVAAVRDPRWAIAYLLVFGLGTIAGMMVITMSLASAFRVAGRRSETATGHIGVVLGVVSMVFGVSFAYQVWAAAIALPPIH
jgi:high-affinity nickel-transport protein